MRSHAKVGLPVPLARRTPFATGLAFPLVIALDEASPSGADHPSAAPLLPAHKFVAAGHLDRTPPIVVARRPRPADIGPQLTSVRHSAHPEAYTPSRDRHRLRRDPGDDDNAAQGPCLGVAQ